MKQTKYDVFISYSRKDYVDEQNNIIPDNAVSKIKEALTEAGFTYWHDEEGVYYGDKFIEKIVKNIETSRIFMFMSSKNSSESTWITKEIACADEFGKPIIPVRIDRTPYNKKVMFRIADLRYVDYDKNPENGFQEILALVKAYLNELKASEKQKEIEEKRRREELERQRKKQEEEKKRQDQIWKWPITPTFLSLRQGCKEDTANYNTDGIYYTDYIRGFLADLSHDKNIQNALSIFQFVPWDFKPNDSNAENPDEITSDPRKATVILNRPLDPKIKEILDKQGKKIIRIDSGTYINNGELCDAFRDCHSEHTSFCFKQDSMVGVFFDPELNECQPNTDDYRQRLEVLIAEFNIGREGKNKIKCDVFPKFGALRRLYIHYTCSKSCFEEHIFPIYVQDRLIACLMFGQVGRDNFDDEESFKEYRAEMEKKHPGCPNNLLKVEYVDTKKWEKKAHAIVERIEIFETRLEERIVHRNTRYVNDAFEEIETKFREEVKNINIKEEDVFSQFTKLLNKAFTDIREKFDSSDDGFIRMFALPISIEHEELVPIGWSGSDFETWKNVKIALKQLKGIENTLEIEDKKERRKEQRRIILEAASKEIRDNFNEELDFFLPGWLAGNEVAYIVWKRHNHELISKNKNNFRIYRRALKNFYSIAQECYSYIRGAKMELLLDTTIQESAHESAHFILPAIDVVENNIEPMSQDVVSLKYIERDFKDKDSFEHYKEVFLNDFLEKYKRYQDSFDKYRAEVLESLHQLREINYGSSLIFSTNLQINKNPVEVFDLLYKLKKTLNNRALDSHKNIYYTQSENYVKANIDAKYFNHALYNLLDNAIKYGYEGSFIRINMNVDREKGMLIVDVVSYGIAIEEGDRIYQLFERDEEAAKIARGTGIGLYIVKKICEAHRGTISHTSNHLSDYNIPVLFNYKYRNTLASKCSIEEIEKFEKELSMLSGLEHEVVYDTRFVKYSLVFSSVIGKPTYRNTFRIQIPLN